VGVTLVTGATGLVGSHVARHVAERGDRLRVTARPRSRLGNLAELDAEVVECDILDRRAVRRAMRGVDRVFHVAGMTNLRADADTLFRINVQGTTIVLEEALRAGVERCVHTSSVAAVGPAPRHTTADERQVFRAGRYGLPYINAKHEAEKEALRIGGLGLPVVVVNPGHVFGAGDVYHSSTEMVRRFLRREIPAYVDGALNIVDADDVARGHLLADERGTPGERYILGNRNFTMDRLFADLARLSGVEPPALKLRLPVALALSAAAERVGAGRAGWFPSPVEVRAASLNWAFTSAKAKRQLGWTPGPHEDCVEATIAWYREHDGGRVAAPGARQPLALRLTAGAVRRSRVLGS
jgi:dihydroflavonol-4-reductase